MSTEHQRGGNHITLEERVGGRVDHDADYHKVRARLTERALVTSTRAIERLEVVRQSYEIDDRALLQTQREVGRQTSEGLAPSTAEFWRSVASPLADRLADAAKEVIDQELEEFAAGTVRFRRGLRDIGSTNPPLRLQAEVDLDAALAHFEGLALDPQPLDAVGERFQRRLRRTASRRMLPRSLLTSPAETERIIDRVEIELLDQPPYSHCDKLLVAFELTHADVRAYVREHIDRLRLISHRQLRRDLG